jgi:hypothetical protein
MRPRYWLDHDPVSSLLAWGLRAWREVTFGRPVLYPKRALRQELIRDFAELDDGEIVNRAQELEAFDRAKLAEVAESGGGVGVPDATGPPDPSTGDTYPQEEVDDSCRPFRVARIVLHAWADQAHDERDETQPGAWGGPEAPCASARAGWALVAGGVDAGVGVATSQQARSERVAARALGADQGWTRTSHGPRRVGRGRRH